VDDCINDVLLKGIEFLGCWLDFFRYFLAKLRNLVYNIDNGDFTGKIKTIAR
jgi:hypothetical protein